MSICIRINNKFLKKIRITFKSQKHVVKQEFILYYSGSIEFTSGPCFGLFFRGYNNSKMVRKLNKGIIRMALTRRF